MAYQAKDFWEARLRQNFSLLGTGHSGFSRRYNRYMYKLRALKLDWALARYNIKVKGVRVLDIGSGTGFFVEYYLAKGAGNISGVDITDISVDSLNQRFPGRDFYKLDISKRPYPGQGKFDIINVFDVLYHITDEQDFKAGLKNILASSKSGSWIFITDSLNPGLGGAEHVCYRKIETYRQILAEEGVDISGILPVFNFMGLNLADYFRGSLLKKVWARVTELAVFLAYLIDSAYCPLHNSRMKLLICKKK